MKHISVLSASLALVLSSSCLTTHAQSGPQKAFDASYEMTNPQGHQSMRMISDGHGHTRMEMVTSHGKVINITDFPNHTHWSLIESAKIATRVPFTDQFESQVMDEATARKRNSTPLGTKVIEGHPCHGWQYVSNGLTTQAWTGDDIGVLVHSESQTNDGTRSMHLKSYSQSLPNPSLFTIPPDYKVTELPSSMPFARPHAAGPNMIFGGAGQNKDSIPPGMPSQLPSGFPIKMPAGIPNSGFPTNYGSDD